MPISILVVEKDPLLRSTIARMLESLQHSITDVDHAEAALLLLHNVRFEIVVVGLSREDPDGAVIAREAKALQLELKIIVASGRLQVGEVSPLIDALQCKPFTIQQFDKTIKLLTDTK